MTVCARAGELSKKLGAEIISDKCKVKFFSDGRKIYKEFEEIKIYNKRGVQDFGELVVPFLTKHEKAKILYAYTILPNGKVVKPSKEAYNIVYPPFVSFAPTYSDLKYKTVSLPAVNPGSTVKYGFQVYLFKPFMKGQFWSKNYFQGRYPVKLSSYTVFVPKGRDVKIKKYHFHGTEKIKKTPKGTIYTFVEKKVPPIIPEPFMPPMGELASHVSITSLKSWQQVAKWYAKLARKAAEPDKSVKKLAEKLTAHIKDKRDKIRAIYSFVSQNIRYVGLEFGINGYKPHKASEILKNRYGDCKDHATLLIAMLKAIGVKAYPVLIPTQGIPDMDLSMPTPTAFNHEIAAIKEGNKWFFMDTTSDFVPFGELPVSDQGRHVLIVDLDTGKGFVEKTPVFPPQENTQGFAGYFKIKSDGSLSGGMEFYYSGVYAQGERASLVMSSPDERKRKVEKLANGISPGFEVNEFKFSNYKDLNETVVSIDIWGKDSLYATKTKDYLIFKMPCPTFSNLAQIVAQKSRKYPFVLGYKFEKVITTSVEIPQGYEPAVKPEGFIYENPVGEFSISYKVFDGKIIMHSKLTLNKYRTSAENYHYLRSLFDTTVKSLRNQIVVLQKISDKTKASPGKGKGAL